MHGGLRRRLHTGRQVQAGFLLIPLPQLQPIHSRRAKGDATKAGSDEAGNCRAAIRCGSCSASAVDHDALVSEESPGNANLKTVLFSNAKLDPFASPSQLLILTRPLRPSRCPTPSHPQHLSLGPHRCGQDDAHGALALPHGRNGQQSRRSAFSRDQLCPSWRRRLWIYGHRLPRARA